MTEKHRDQEPPRTPVAVQKRVYCFKLRMHERRMDQRQGLFFIMKEFLKVVKCVFHVRNGRRDKIRIGGGCATDPIGRGAKFARTGKMGGAGPLYQLVMDFTDKS